MFEGRPGTKTVKTLTVCKRNCDGRWKLSSLDAIPTQNFALRIAKADLIHLRNVKNKVVKQYENISNPQRCHVKMLDRYFELLPKEARSNDVCPLSKTPTEPGKPLCLWEETV